MKKQFIFFTLLAILNLSQFASTMEVGEEEEEREEVVEALEPCLFPNEIYEQLLEQVFSLDSITFDGLNILKAAKKALMEPYKIRSDFLIVCRHFSELLRSNNLMACFERYRQHCKNLLAQIYAYEYADLDTEELNDLLKITLESDGDDDNENKENKIALLIVAGADPNIFYDHTVSDHYYIQGPVVLEDGETLSGRIRVEHSEITFNHILSEILYDDIYLNLIPLLILFGVDVNIEHLQQTALMLASKNGHENIAELLILFGANVNARYGNDSALTLAIKCEQEPAAMYLICYGANVDIIAYEGNTPLTFASRFGLENVVMGILGLNVDINAKNQSGNTSLMLAIGYYNENVAKILIASGADVNLANGYGQAPLIEASKLGYLDLVKMLLAYGADVNLRNNLNVSALDMARSCNNLEIVEFLESLNDSNKID